MFKTSNFSGKLDKATSVRDSRGPLERSLSPTAGLVNKSAVAPSISSTDPVMPVSSDPLLSNGTEVPKTEKTAGNRLLVGPDVKLKGAEILDCDMLVVEGRVEATMDSHTIRIAEQGVFCGTVSIDTAEIYGLFEGELIARNQLIIHATGRVTGKIRYGKILIEEGGQIGGDIQSTAADLSASAIQTESKTVTIAARA